MITMIITAIIIIWNNLMLMTIVTIMITIMIFSPSNKVPSHWLMSIEEMVRSMIRRPAKDLLIMIKMITMLMMITPFFTFVPFEEHIILAIMFFPWGFEREILILWWKSLKLKALKWMCTSLQLWNLIRRRFLLKFSRSIISYQIWQNWMS